MSVREKTSGPRASGLGPRPAKTTTKAKAKPKAKAKQPKQPKRDPQLEALAAAVIEAPLDPLARLVLGDSMQAHGQRLGDWVALAAGLEADPKNVRLRAASVAFLDEHREAMLGEGAQLLPGAWIGWRGGFIDELRLQPFHGVKAGPERVAALLAHPSCRFVRTIAIGDWGPQSQAIVDAIARAAPPILETFVALDAVHVTRHQPRIDGIARLASLRRLGLSCVELGAPIANVRELVLSRCGAALARYLADGHAPAVEELVIEGTDIELAVFARIVDAMPRLTRLRLIGSADIRAQLGAIERHLARLTLLDVSHTDFRDYDATKLVDFKNLELVAIRTNVVAAPRTLRASTTSYPPAPKLQLARDDMELTTWIPQQLAVRGRAALELIPGIGVPVYDLGTHLNRDHQPAKAMPLLEVSVTLPIQSIETWPWANAAIAHERLFQFDEAELVGREGLLRAPFEPNFFAIVIDALRRSNRLSEALELVPRARAALARRTKSRHSAGAATCCLLDCLYALAQGGRHADVVELAIAYRAILSPDCHAVVAMSYVALGKLAKARTAMKRAEDSTTAVKHHAHAVLALARPTWTRAAIEAELAEIERLAYPEMHWLAFDPNLAAFRAISSARA